MHLAERNPSDPCAPGAALANGRDKYPTLHVDASEDFLLADRAEIGAVLSDIAWLNTTLTIHTQSGSVAHARVLHANLREERLLMDRAMDGCADQALTVSVRNRMCGAIRGAPVVFETGPLHKAKHKGRLAFEVGFPAALYYVQRRRHFRASVAPGTGFSCVLKMGGQVALSMSIVDISLSGVRLRGPAERAPALARGAEFNGALLNFGQLGQLAVDLRVMGCWPADGNLTAGALYGCAFLDLPMRAENVLQRIVTSLELQAANRRPATAGFAGA